MSIDLGKIGYKVEIDDSKYEALLRKMEGRAEDSASNIGSTFKKAFAVLGGLFALKEGLSGARAFSDELANIKSIASEFDAARLRKEITNLSSTLGTSAEMANALFFAYSSGVRGTEAEMAQFVGQVAALAKTIGGGVTPVMNAATTMMNAYGLSVKEAGNLSDWFYQIVKSGKTTGAELAQSLGQIAATAANSGISLDELGAALATLTTTMPTNIAVTSLAASIRALMNPTDETRKVAEKLGIELSMAAIKAKGFGGVMEEIYRKTEGRADLIGKLFPAESSRAIMSLAGTQINTLKQNLVNFADKGGAAAAGFNEKMKSLDVRLDALRITGQKILTVVADMTVQVLTLGGALNPLLEKFMNLKEEGVAFVAKLLAITGGAYAAHKVLSALQKLQSGLMGRSAAREAAEAIQAERAKAAAAAEAEAVKIAAAHGAEQEKRAAALREAAAVSGAEKAKQLSAAQSVAARREAERQRHLEVMVNAAREKAALLGTAQAAQASAQRNFNTWGQRNESARYQYVLQNKSARGFVELPEYAAARKELAATTQAVHKNEKALNDAQLAAGRARKELREAHRETVATTSAVKSHSAAVAAGRAPAAPGSMMPGDDFRRADVQARWDARNARRAGERLSRLNSGGSAADHLPGANRQLETNFANLGKTSGAVLPPLKKMTGGLREFGQEAAEGLKQTIKTTASMQAWRNGLSSTWSVTKNGATGVFNALSGGLKGLSGVLQATANAAVSVGVAMAGWELGKWIADASGFADWVANLWAGTDVKEHERQNQEQIDAQGRRRQEQEKNAEAAEEKRAEDLAQKERAKRIFNAKREYDFNRADTRTQIHMLNADLMNSQSKLNSGDLGPEQKTEETERYWKIRAQLDAAKKQLEDEKRNRDEERRSVRMSQYRNTLAADGELGEADQLLLQKMEIAQQEERIAEAKERAAKADREAKATPGDLGKQDKRLAALREEAEARGKLYDLQRQQRQDEIAYRQSQRETRNRIAMSSLLIDRKSDGNFSTGDQIDVEKLKIKQAAEAIADLAKRMADAADPDEKARLQAEQNQLRLDQMASMERIADLLPGGDLNKMRNTVQTATAGSMEAYRLRSALASNSSDQADKVRKEQLDMLKKQFEAQSAGNFQLTQIAKNTWPSAKPAIVTPGSTR